MGGRVLVIDDEDVFREDLARLLRDEGYSCRTASEADEGVAVAEAFQPEVVLCDVVLPGTSGLDIIERIFEASPGSCVFMITAFGTLETALDAFRRGVSDYLLKPLAFPDVFHKVAHALEHRRLRSEVRLLGHEVTRLGGDRALLGESRPMRRLRDIIDRVAPTDSTVLLTGESGVGKEVVARGIHQGGANPGGPFVAVNCAALPEPLLERELFGHRKGAFTGAHRDQEGFFIAAADGTILLDEIGEMPAGLQPKLLRAIEAREVTPVGASRPFPVRARIICATNRDLAAMVADGRFREDLYFRIRVIEICVPSLRERREDLPIFIGHILEQLNRRLGKRVRGLDREAMRVLMAARWPGNVRELENVLERAVILADTDTIGLADLPPDLAGEVRAGGATDDLREAVQAYEREHVRQVLEACGGNREEAARRLGVNPSTLYRKLAQYGPLDG